jgi:hypothetical protein
VALFRRLFRALIPWTKGGSAQIHAVDEKLQCLSVELDAALSRLAGGRPTESAFFQPFCREPQAGAIEVEDLDAVAAFVGEDEEGIAGGGGAELVGGELLETVEGFAHVAGIEGEEDFEGVGGEVQHGAPPFAARWSRKAAMKSAASGTASRSSSRSERPSLNSMTRRGRSWRGNSTSTKRASVHFKGCGEPGSGLDMAASVADQGDHARGWILGRLPLTQEP